jgi:hypothetical protein
VLRSSSHFFLKGIALKKIFFNCDKIYIKFVVWGGRREEGSRWGARVYLWWIHLDKTNTIL